MVDGRDGSGEVKVNNKACIGGSFFLILFGHSSLPPSVLSICKSHSRFFMFCLSLDISSALLVSTSMCVKQSVALEQLAFKIQYKLPGRELLRNSDSLCAFVTGLDM